MSKELWWHKSVTDWWEKLDDEDYKIKLMEKVRPDEANMIEADELWYMSLDWEERYAIWCSETEEKDKEAYLNETPN